MRLHYIFFTKQNLHSLDIIYILWQDRQAMYHITRTIVDTKSDPNIMYFLWLAACCCALTLMYLRISNVNGFLVIQDV